MAELADATDLGSVGQPCRFKSCYPQFFRVANLLERVINSLDFGDSFTILKIILPPFLWYSNTKLYITLYTQFIIVYPVIDFSEIHCTKNCTTIAPQQKGEEAPAFFLLFVHSIFNNSTCDFFAVDLAFVKPFHPAIKFISGIVLFFVIHFRKLRGFL